MSEAFNTAWKLAKMPLIRDSIKRIHDPEMEQEDLRQRFGHEWPEEEWMATADFRDPEGNLYEMLAQYKHPNYWRAREIGEEQAREGEGWVGDSASWPMTVAARDGFGNVVSRANLEDSFGHRQARNRGMISHVKVDEPHRRKGLQTGMYDLMAELGFPVMSGMADDAMIESWEKNQGRPYKIPRRSPRAVGPWKSTVRGT